MQAQVLVVAPFTELADSIKQVIGECFGTQKQLFRVLEADLQDAEKLVQQGLPKSIKVIVSRGGTAVLLEKLNMLPVVSIQVSGMDIAQAVYNHKEYKQGKKVGVVGFPNMLYGCEELESILKSPLVELEIQDEENVAAKISAAMEAGVDFVVGDAVSVRVAQEKGIPASIITSGKQAILQALQEALLIAQVVSRDEVKSQLLRSVVNQAQDGIIAINEKQEITVFNPKAELLFHRFSYDVLGRPLQEVCPELLEKDGSNGEENVIDVFGKQVLIKKAVIQNADLHMGIYTLQQVSEVQRIEQNIRKRLTTKGLTAKYHLNDIIGASAPCTTMKEKAARYALTDSTILITGESGTGKEMLVQGIHNKSNRASGPFVAVNCAALPENLLESELFGYVEGAFTGAKRGGRQGMFELAHGGTLFLDEIGEMPMPLQSRLLRVLQEREVMPIGGEAIIPIDVRVIAATNKNLGEMVAKGEFRQDLYYRLNILRIHMPVLAERWTDIPLLVKGMLTEMSKVNPRISSIDDEALEVLSCQRWPGNIRQLRNMVERIMLLANGACIDKQAVLLALEDDGEEGIIVEPLSSADSLETLATEKMQQVLAEEGYNYSRAAKRLGIHRTTLWRKLRK